MVWFLVWIVLVLAAIGLLGLLARRLWRQAKALTAEMSRTVSRFDDVVSRLESLSAAEAGRHTPYDVR